MNNTERQRQWRAAHPNYYRDMMRKKRAAHPDKYKKQQAEWRAKNPEYGKKWAANHRKELTAYYMKIRRDARQELLDTMGNKCSRCGSVNDLHFHHINPKEKSFSIGRGPANRLRILEEGRKCIILCKPCHRKHHKQFGY